ncbi:hypothetical protein [Mycobacterium sp. 852013-50091_SCH5140682]|nr:hypothetical protein [Mycobacterium sp. 852013-50091_SCH5140682]
MTFVRPIWLPGVGDFGRQRVLTRRVPMRLDARDSAVDVYKVFQEKKS